MQRVVMKTMMMVFGYSLAIEFSICKLNRIKNNKKKFMMVEVYVMLHHLVSR
jgi:hypothetical protein